MSWRIQLGVEGVGGSSLMLNEWWIQCGVDGVGGFSLMLKELEGPAWC